MLKYPNLLIGSMGLSVFQNIQFNSTERINSGLEKYLKQILRRNQMSQGRFLTIWTVQVQSGRSWFKMDGQDTSSWRSRYMCGYVGNPKVTDINLTVEILKLDILLKWLSTIEQLAVHFHWPVWPSTIVNHYLVLCSSEPSTEIWFFINHVTVKNHKQCKSKRFENIISHFSASSHSMETYSRIKMVLPKWTIYHKISL